jgi:predicted nucleic acid-binding Zn ribbon protein
MTANKCLVCRSDISQPKLGPVGKSCSNKCRTKLHREKAAQWRPNIFKSGSKPVTCAQTVQMRILSDSQRPPDIILKTALNLRYRREKWDMN